MNKDYEVYCSSYDGFKDFLIEIDKDKGTSFVRQLEKVQENLDEFFDELGYVLGYDGHYTFSGFRKSMVDSELSYNEQYEMLLLGLSVN